jgi:hypothetical protein
MVTKLLCWSNQWNKIFGSNRHIQGAGTGEYSVLVGRPRFSEGEMTLRVSVLSASTIQNITFTTRNRDEGLQ